MFKRENRLIPGISFGGAKFATNSQFTLKEKPNRLILNRFGIIVSKKVNKRAVVRNKVKRLLRTALEKMSGKIDPGHDILLMAKKEILNKTKGENLIILERTLEEIGLIKK